MLFKKTLALASVTSVGLTSAQIVGDTTLYQPTYPSTIYCGWDCPINGEWLAVPQAFFNSYGCGTLVRLTYESGTPPWPTTVVPICDICTTCTSAEWEASPPVFGALGHGGASSLLVEYNI